MFPDDARGAKFEALRQKIEKITEIFSDGHNFRQSFSTQRSRKIPTRTDSMRF